MISPNKTTVSVRMPKTMKQRIKAISAKTGATENSIILMAISKWIDQDTKNSPSAATVESR